MRTAAPFDDDKPREECGVFAIFGHPEAAAHRGARPARPPAPRPGGGRHRHLRRPALPPPQGAGPRRRQLQQRRPSSRPCRATPRSATCATPPTGASWLRNVQPLFADFAFGGLAIAHNGNLTNALGLRRQLVEEGSLFHSTSDTEVIVHLIATSRKATIVDRVADALRQVEGAYVAGRPVRRRHLIGVRDPLGVRPLVLGRLDGAYVLASETCALDIMGAELRPRRRARRDRGRQRGGRRSSLRLSPARHAPLLHLRVRLLRPARQRGRGQRRLRGHASASARSWRARRGVAGRRGRARCPTRGVPAAIGYAQEAGLPFELGIIRNHYVGRTFIEPTDSIRHLGVRLKHNANRADARRASASSWSTISIVRGTTSTKIVAMVREAGAAEVHMRIASPPTTHCLLLRRRHARAQQAHGRQPFGRGDGRAHRRRLARLPVDRRTLPRRRRARPRQRHPQFCDACFTGDYPTRLADCEGQVRQDQLSLLLEDA